LLRRREVVQDSERSAWLVRAGDLKVLALEVNALVEPMAQLLGRQHRRVDNRRRQVAARCCDLLDCDEFLFHVSVSLGRGAVSADIGSVPSRGKFREEKWFSLPIVACERSRTGERSLTLASSTSHEVE